MMTGSFRLLLVVTAGLALAGCGKPPATQTAAGSATEPASQSGQQAAAQGPSAMPPADAGAPSLPRSPSAAGAAVTIISPRDGDVVASPVKVVMGLQGMTVAPAGDPTPNSGHHHLLVDVPAPDLGQPIPKDAAHLHFGQGQTEAEIPLAPGQHTLQMILADSNHVPHNPPLISAPVTITVQ